MNLSVSAVSKNGSSSIKITSLSKAKTFVISELFFFHIYAVILIILLESSEKVKFNIIGITNPPMFENFNS